MTDQNMVSIIIPLYNGAKFIDSTLKSCLNQIYTNIEILVVDDGSSDNGAALVNKQASLDCRIRYLKNPENMGFIQSVNRGVHCCHGSHILILGHDDELGPTHVKLMMSHFSSEIGILCSDAVKINENGLELGMIESLFKKDDIKNNPLYHLYFGNVIQSCGMIIDKNKFLELGGYDPRFKNYGEWLFYIKMAARWKIVYCKEGSGRYRQHDSNISHTFNDENIKSDLYNYFQICRAEAWQRNSLKNKTIILGKLIKEKLFNP